MASKQKRKYVVLIYGRNFRLLWQERRKTVTQLTGFYTTRCVVASDATDAEYRAIDLVRNDPKLIRSVRNKRSDAPLMFAVDIREVASFAPLKPPGTGYAFFHGRGAGRPRATLE